MPEEWMNSETEILINPTGKFVIGGPDGDTGLTGRKIIVDTYGGAAPHGGGAFSGKDPTKVDRSAAYISRYIAKNIVASRLAEKCTLQLAYAIGVSDPLSIYVDTHGTSKMSDDELIKKISSNVDLTPRGIRDLLNLHKPIYKKSAAYGHFGREPGDDGSFSWEKTDMAENLQNFLFTLKEEFPQYYNYQGRRISKKLSNTNINLLNNHYYKYTLDKKIIDYHKVKDEKKKLILIKVILVK